MLGIFFFGYFTNMKGKLQKEIRRHGIEFIPSQRKIKRMVPYILEVLKLEVASPNYLNCQVGKQDLDRHMITT